MLVFTLRPGESFFVGDAQVTVLTIRGQKVRVGTKAHSTVPVHREKVRRRIEKESAEKPSPKK